MWQNFRFFLLYHLINSRTTPSDFARDLLKGARPLCFCRTSTFRFNNLSVIFILYSFTSGVLMQWRAFRLLHRYFYYFTHFIDTCNGPEYFLSPGFPRLRKSNPVRLHVPAAIWVPACRSEVFYLHMSCSCEAVDIYECHCYSESRGPNHLPVP